MVGAQSLVNADIIPFCIASGNRAKLSGVNVIGLERRGFSTETITGLRDFFRFLIRGEGLFADRLSEAKKKFNDKNEFDSVFNFIDNAGQNGICQSFKR